MASIDLTKVTDEDLAAEYARRSRVQALAAAQILVDQFTPEMRQLMNDGHAYGLSGMATVIEAQAPLISADLPGLRTCASMAGRALRQLAAEWQAQVAPSFTILAQEE